MTHFSFIFFCFFVKLVAVLSLKLLQDHRDCQQWELAQCKITDCAENMKVDPIAAPTMPLLDPEHGTIRVDGHQLLPVMKVAWRIPGDASYLALTGSQIDVVDENGNKSLCVQFNYKLNGLKRVVWINQTEDRRWNFSLGVVVKPAHNYTVRVSNLPEPNHRSWTQPTTFIQVPGCDDGTIQKAKVCQENGSLWSPDISGFTKKEPKTFTVTFTASQYSENYQVSIKNTHHCLSKNVLKENRTLLNVTFEFDWSQLSECKVLVMIQPFFVGCKQDCWLAEKTVDFCKDIPPNSNLMQGCVGLLIVASVCLALSLWKTARKDHPMEYSSASKEQPAVYQVQERKRILIIYSLDHFLYKNIVLKLSAFLATKCGTEVVLDLLDSTRVGELGSIQWLDWHKRQIENSSDKILILCSRGVQAKWRAMCGADKVYLKEDARSPVGDMLTSSLTLLLPHFIHSDSFKKYIVAYFDGISSEEDIPSPFKVTVRYQLMKQFEEFFFRILDTEKHEPGRVKQIDGLSEHNYHQCPSGKALCDAIQAFLAYQQNNPHWFKDELLKSPDLEEWTTNEKPDEDSVIMKSLSTYCLFDQHVSRVEAQEDARSLKLSGKCKMCLMFNFNPEVDESCIL